MNLHPFAKNGILSKVSDPPQEPWHCDTEIGTPTNQHVTCVFTHGQVEIRVAFRDGVDAPTLEGAVHDFAKVFDIYIEQVVRDFDLLDRECGAQP